MMLLYSCYDCELGCDGGYDYGDGDGYRSLSEYLCDCYTGQLSTI